MPGEPINPRTWILEKPDFAAGFFFEIKFCRYFHRMKTNTKTA